MRISSVILIVMGILGAAASLLANEISGTGWALAFAARIAFEELSRG